MQPDYFPWFQVRKGDDGEHRMAVTRLPDGTPVTVADWPEVLKLAGWFQGRDPYECSADIWWQGERYIGTLCGGEVYWTDHDEVYPQTERMHQVGSLGHCWECFHAGYGFIRHPVTPQEVIDGTLNPIRIRFENPRSNEPCDACGGGYTKPCMMTEALAALEADPDNTPLDGGKYAITYVRHGGRCARMDAGPEHKALREARTFCAGCRGTCCTGDPQAGPCTCTEADRLAALGIEGSEDR